MAAPASSQALVKGHHGARAAGRETFDLVILDQLAGRGERDLECRVNFAGRRGGSWPVRWGAFVAQVWPAGGRSPNDQEQMAGTQIDGGRTAGPHDCGRGVPVTRRGRRRAPRSARRLERDAPRERLVNSVEHARRDRPGARLSGSDLSLGSAGRTASTGGRPMDIVTQLRLRSRCTGEGGGRRPAGPKEPRESKMMNTHRRRASAHGTGATEQRNLSARCAIGAGDWQRRARARRAAACATRSGGSPPRDADELAAAAAARCAWLRLQSSDDLLCERLAAPHASGARA